MKDVVVSGISMSRELGLECGGLSLNLNYEEFEYVVYQGDSSHRVSYNLNNYTTLLDGEPVPSTYIATEGEDDDYWKQEESWALQVPVVVILLL